MQGILISQFTIKDDKTRGKRKSITFCTISLGRRKTFSSKLQQIIPGILQAKNTGLQPISVTCTFIENDLIFRSIPPAPELPELAVRTIFSDTHGGFLVCLFVFWRDNDTGSILEFFKEQGEMGIGH